MYKTALALIVVLGLFTATAAFGGAAPTMESPYVSYSIKGTCITAIQYMPRTGHKIAVVTGCDGWMFETYHTCDIKVIAAFRRAVTTTYRANMSPKPVIHWGVTLRQYKEFLDAHWPCADSDTSSPSFTDSDVSADTY